MCIGDKSQMSQYIRDPDNFHGYKQQVDILISKNEALQILYPSSIIPCMIIINFTVYNDTVLQCYTQTYVPNISLVKITERPQPQ